jgi:hypothetical protein
MNAKKKNPQPVGKTQPNKSQFLNPTIIQRKPTLTETWMREAEQQLKSEQKITRQMQAAGTAPSDDVEKTADLLYSSAGKLLGLILSNYRSQSEPNMDMIEAEKRFCKFARWLIEELSGLSRWGYYDPLRAAWDGGRVLAETIHDVALDGPGASYNLQIIARTALLMPSLRANTKSFEYDFKKIAENIQLSKDHTIRVDPQAEYQMDRSATRFVVKMIEHFAFLRETLAREKAEFLQFKKNPQAMRGSKGAIRRGHFKFFELTLPLWLACNYSYEVVEELLLCEGIKPLSKDTAEEWLKHFLRPLARSRRDIQDLIGFSFYQEIEASSTKSKTSKRYGVEDELIKRCRQVLQGKTFFRDKAAPTESISPAT